MKMEPCGGIGGDRRAPRRRRSFDDRSVDRHGHHSSGQKSETKHRSRSPRERRRRRSRSRSRNGRMHRDRSQSSGRCRRHRSSDGRMTKSRRLSRSRERSVERRRRYYSRSRSAERKYRERSRDRSRSRDHHRRDWSREWRRDHREMERHRKSKNYDRERKRSRSRSRDKERKYRERSRERSQNREREEDRHCRRERERSDHGRRQKENGIGGGGGGEGVSPPLDSMAAAVSAAQTAAQRIREKIAGGGATQVKVVVKTEVENDVMRPAERPRKSRLSNTKAVILPPPGIILTSSNLENETQRQIYLLTMEIDDCTRQIRCSKDFKEPTTVVKRSASPEPTIYDANGGKRWELEQRRHEKIQALRKLNPDYKPPGDYRPPNPRRKDNERRKGPLREPAILNRNGGKGDGSNSVNGNRPPKTFECLKPTKSTAKSKCAACGSRGHVAAFGKNPRPIKSEVSMFETPGPWMNNHPTTVSFTGQPRFPVGFPPQNPHFVVPGGAMPIVPVNLAEQVKNQPKQGPSTSSVFAPNFYPMPTDPSRYAAAAAAWAAYMFALGYPNAVPPLPKESGRGNAPGGSAAGPSGAGFAYVPSPPAPVPAPIKTESLE